MLHRFAYLKPALAVLLIFVGGKVFAADMLGLTKVPPLLSLGVTFANFCGRGNRVAGADGAGRHRTNGIGTFSAAPRRAMFPAMNQFDDQDAFEAGGPPARRHPAVAARHGAHRRPISKA